MLISVDGLEDFFAKIHTQLFDFFYNVWGLYLILGLFNLDYQDWVILLKTLALLSVLYRMKV